MKPFMFVNDDPPARSAGLINKTPGPASGNSFACRRSEAGFLKCGRQALPAGLNTVVSLRRADIAEMLVSWVAKTKPLPQISVHDLPYTKRAIV